MTNKIDPFDLSAELPKIEGNLRPASKFAERISKRVLFVVFGVLGVVVATFLFALDSMDKKPEVKPKENVSTHSNETSAIDDLMRAGTEKSDVNMSGLTAQDKIPTQQLPVPAVPAIPEIPAIPEVQRVTVLTPEQQQALAEKQARYQRDLQARTQGMASKAFIDAESVGGPGAGAQAANLLKQAEGMGGGAQPAFFAGNRGEEGGGAEGEHDQDRKIDFLSKTGKENQSYHQYVAVPALSKNEIKTGSFIPMVLEQSINSDLPGQITARVTEDIYDSITGCRMLIPAMSKVVGRYDSKVAIGQNRILIAWNSLIFRDGAELNLAGLQGYDTSGQAGLESDVDNHYWRLFGLTFGLSMITSAVQLSIPQPNQGANGTAAAQTPAQTIAAGLAQQYGNLGSQIIGKYMAVQPTLRNYAGERFVVMVPRTIVFNKVWRTRCAGIT